MPKPLSPPSTSLRAAATRRVNRQMAAVNATIRAYQGLREAEKAGDAPAAMSQLRAALDQLEFEGEQA